MRTFISVGSAFRLCTVSHSPNALGSGFWSSSFFFSFSSSVIFFSNMARYLALAAFTLNLSSSLSSTGSSSSSSSSS